MTKRTSTRARAVVAAAAAALLVGLTSPAQAADDDTTIQILGINDFHGRILPDSFGGSAGGASLVTAVHDLESEYPDSVFAAAGDLIGASTFESFIAHDKPTIDVFNNAGLDVSAVGNHEFDKGYDDLVNRVMQPESASNPEGGAQWQYLGANVRHVDTGDPALPETWITSFGDVEVGFIGAVTDATPSLVTPDGVAGLTFEKEYVAANRSADALKSAGADLVILLVHEGAPTTAYADAVDPSNDFGEMLANLSPDIDAVISGHTHLAYDHRVPVPEWASEGRAVTERPVVSAGQYGMFLNQLLFTVNSAGEVTGVTTDIIDLDATEKDDPACVDIADDPATPDVNEKFTCPRHLVYPPDPATAALVQAAKDQADVLGAEVLGQVEAPLYRATVAGGAPGDSRGGESTLGNAVADIQLWATQSSGAQIAFMNPGGLRADLLGSGAGDPAAYPADVTYKQAAEVQPFANTLVTMTLTGDQIADLLQEQWQPAGSSRPFLRLGTSSGFAYTYDPDTHEILTMTLDGEPIAPADEVTVTANSFLAAGGDNFTTFRDGTDRADSGRVDLQAQVDYLAANGTVPVSYAQHSVGVSGLDTALKQNTTVSFDLSSLMMTGPGDVTDSTVTVTLGKKTVGTFAVVNDLPTEPYDEQGTASIEFTVPKNVKGDVDLVITGDATGTSVSIPVSVAKADNPGNAHGHGRVIAHRYGHLFGHGHWLWFGQPGHHWR